MILALALNLMSWTSYLASEHSPLSLSLLVCKMGTDMTLPHRVVRKGQSQWMKEINIVIEIKEKLT